MRCEQWREILSAQLDGEETPAERAGAEEHLDSCENCRRWFDAAAAVTRRARTQVVTSLPDLTDAILAAAPPQARRSRRQPTAWRGRLLAGLRGALGLLGAVQLVLGLAQIGRGAVTDHLHAGQHLWHESAAWNVAVGAGFLLVALRRTPPAGLLPMLSVFVATLVLLSVNDLITAQVDVTRLVSHGFLLGGYLITLLLSRPGLRPGPPPQQGQPRPSRWRAQLDDAEQPAVPLRLLPPQPYSAQAVHRRAA
ncbi:Predicted anti-sigma-YlaC factor YlaD, contains Zn-finger domain [Micromonospora rhizosphaerae]|uniref:Predicted anti-sigma-YlaC factor YlaD, contains Zn-finger domain n=1 Tax=Micromonospora rhizosphaerae TaxID=568872 RepID=A0A1C6S0A7_9ACTN|nr:zf-HC2 domain-containing protein [Micromonospora rhizosphaerae]SCL22928.1 Predicted anti-sigma-YlaC factor YlaD, contains Zn-finger domain [Micromonospora rhizosphaerae]